MRAKRVMRPRSVAVTRRVWRTVTLTKQVLQCERPYVLFGEAVREARLALEMTQQQLADKIGHGRPSIANIETGRQRVFLDDVAKFARMLKLDPVALFKATMK